MMNTTTPSPAPARRKAIAVSLALAAAVAAAAGLTRLIPDEYRPYNFTAVGAVALFAAARIGLWPGLIISLLALLASDFALWRQHDYEADYLPMPVVYVCIAGYAVLARVFLAKSENPVLIGGVTVLAGVIFFLVTNFASWCEQALAYGYSPGGLRHSYEMGLPFYRGTLTGDLLFSGLLFATHAVLVRAAAPKPALGESA